MLSKLFTAVLRGISAELVTVETSVNNGMPIFNVVGLADTMVKEAKERIRSAFICSGYVYPQGRISINMAPAYIHKRGTQLDVAMAMGLLLASGQVFSDEIKDYCILGELSLDGSIKYVSGVLAAAEVAKDHGIKNLIVPKENAEEASLARGINIYVASNLESVVAHFMHEKRLSKVNFSKIAIVSEPVSLDYADIKGQLCGKRAMVIAAAGGHGILMVGSPSSGKTMLAERFPGILPDMTEKEILDTSMIYSSSSLLDRRIPVLTKRPFRRPHHRITTASMIGGGLIPKPGEVSLATNGV